MKRELTAIALVLLWCGACATVQAVAPNTQLAEAQQAFDEGQRLKETGHSAQGIPFIERALKLRREVLPEIHPKVADCLSLLGEVFLDLADYARAELVLVRALEIQKAALGQDHPDVARSLNNLAFLYSSQGLYSRAEPLYERALKIREAALGPNHPDVATSLNNLAALYDSQGLYSRAEPLYERALKIQEAALGPNHPNVARSLNNLAFLYKTQGLYAQAEPLHERALKIWEATFGPNHPDVALSLSNLAALYKAQGLYAKAKPLLERALGILASALGDNHPAVANTLHKLALLHLAQNHLDAALPLFERAFASSEQHLRQEVFGLSEQRLATILHQLRTQEEDLYALVRAHPNNARVLHLALSISLLRKGRSVQEVSNTSLITHHRLSLTDREIFERLRTVRMQFATLSLAGPGNSSPADHQQRLMALLDEGDALEEDLSRRSEPLRRLHELPSLARLVSRVAEALPTDSALVEFVTYKDSPLVAKPGLPLSQVGSHLRYLALLLFPDGTTRAVDLGPAEPIDRAALRLHDGLARQSLSYLPASQALYTLAFRPLMPHLGRVQRLFLTPDGQLNLVPFAALHDGKRFLVDAFHITYLTSGKDLLPHPENVPSTRSVVVLADPDFGSPPATPSHDVQSAPALTERSASLERFFSTLRTDGPDTAWAPLPGTRKEAETIHRLFPHAQLLLGADATKGALLKLSSPSLLHIATHGFFREDVPSMPDSRAVGYMGAVAASPESLPADPLLRSGLVLAGAHPPTASPGSLRPENSLVTALELAGLNLWGTQLVVLSACDTGRGDVKLGDGVYGLRQSFLVAGAETVVTSLWKVNDDVTHQLMERYYRHLLAGLGRTSALREAMRDLRRKHPHPHFWAAFTALGLDAPLQGLALPTQVMTAP
jgi:CHAT domain-containing protein/tetratricopeptide (TPR) repeat protein